MSAIGGPNIVEDGLVLALDAANVKSFRGEPTTNLLTTPDVGFTTQSHMSISTLSMTGPFGNSQSVRRFSHTSADPRSGGDQRMRGLFTLTNKNVLYTYSAYLYIEPGTEAQNTGQFWRVSQTGGNHWQSPFATIVSSTVHDWDKVGQWQRISVTFQPDVGNSSNTFNILYYNRVALGSGLIVTAGQMEAKPYATPFVNGTRGTTVATGGGWADRSGNSNHGSLVNNPTFDSANLGSLSFDGTNDSITIPFNASTMDFSQAQTICMWIRPGTGSTSARRNPYNQAYGGSGTITHEPSGGFNYFFGTHGGNSQPYVGRGSGFNVASNELAFISVTRSQSLNLCRWYKNGQAGTFNNAGGYASTNNGSSSILIANGYTNRFIGDIYYVAVYNRYMTQEEVLQNYNATKGRFGL